MYAADTNVLRELAEDAIEQLALKHNNSRNHAELRLLMLTAIDQVMLYLEARHAGTPEAVRRALASVTQAATLGDVPRVIHQTLNALDTSDRFVKAQSTKRTATDVETGKLLKALQRKKMPNV